MPINPEDEFFTSDEPGYDYSTLDEYDYDEDPRVNPCPECDEGEVLVTKPRADVPEYVCSDGCGWSA